MILNDEQKELLNAAKVRSQLRDLLTIEELSKFTGISVRSIQRMHQNGQGPRRIRRGHRLVYPVADLLMWLAVTTGASGTAARRYRA
jgi:predicted DNA-binding transcriptional regulator AlpA